ncbi:MAG: hypothetical protein KDI75_04185 [Xanthomonadales bacterium]|nr:hypothetical protein [Xanthomonadales bacterium]
MATRYFIRLPDPAAARGSDTDLAFTASGADAFAEQLQVALRVDALYRRWKAKQPADADGDDDDREDPLAATDPAATVSGEQNDLAIDLVVTTVLAGSVLKHRLRLLAGSHWELRDVRGT